MALPFLLMPTQPIAANGVPHAFTRRMFKHQINAARIEGHGNVVGNGNQVIIQNHVNAGAREPSRSNRERSAEKSGGKSDGGEVIAIGVAATCAIAFAAWKFAFYANAIYFSLVVALALTGIVQVVTCLYGYLHDADMQWLVKRLLAIAGVLACGAAVAWSRASYPPELVAFAGNATGFRGFMCSMNTTGHQLAIAHMLSICFAAVPALLIFAANAGGAALASLAVATNWYWFDGLAERLAGMRALWVGLAFASLVVFAQTTVGFELLADAVVSPEHDPFLRNAKGFNFCH